jgi:predicted ATPase
VLWQRYTHVTPLILGPLARQDVLAMITHITGDKTLSPAVLHQIIANADGIPLFVEELTRAALASGVLQDGDTHTAPAPAMASVIIPITLYDALIARLDQLGAGKTVMQIGGIIGRQFPYALLQALSPFDEGTLQGLLLQLVEAELLYQRGVPPQVTYVFKHALMQQAAVTSLDRQGQHALQRRVAEVLAARFPGVPPGLSA